MIKAKLPKGDRDAAAVAWRKVYPPVLGEWTPLGFHPDTAPSPGAPGVWACGWRAPENAWTDEEGDWMAVPAVTFAVVIQDPRLTGQERAALAKLQGGGGGGGEQTNTTAVVGRR